jgi:hypothetical protein
VVVVAWVAVVVAWVVVVVAWVGALVMRGPVRLSGVLRMW